MQNYYYCNKPGNLRKDCWKRIREEKAKNNKNKDNKKIRKYCKIINHEEKDCYKKKKAENNLQTTSLKM